MPNDSDNNTYNLGAAPPNALRAHRYDERDEAVFLRQQADDAKQAMQQTLAAMRETAKTAADARAWTRAYPWPSVGMGAVAGFMASALLPYGKQADAPRPESSWVSFVQSSLLGVLRSAVISAITSAVVTQPPEPEPDQDGLFDERVEGRPNADPPFDSRLSDQG